MADEDRRRALPDWSTLRSSLFEPVDIASLVIFRMMFGAILFWEVWRFFGNDWVRRFYIDRTFYFKYFGFDWVQPWPGNGMYLHFIVVGMVALGVMVGYLYRLSSIVLFLGFTYWFLLDQTRYLNHMYLVALLAFLITLMPLHRAKSIDALVKPEIRSDTAPAWCLWLLRTQVGLVYFFAGVAKLNRDWLRGEPIRQWLARRDDYPIIGPWLETEPAVWLFAYGGLLFDLLVAPALLWPKTRWYAFSAAVFFHLTNKIMFDIGIFPVMMMAATLLMLPPDWPRKIPLFFTPLTGRAKEPTSDTPALLRNATVAFLGLWLAVQVILPIRHFFYPGNVHWTEEGHRYAWHMKLRQKRADIVFLATEPSSEETWEVDQSEYLSTAQMDRVGRWPDMTLQFAHFLAEELERDGYEDVEIRVESFAALNGRQFQPLFDPDVDLADEPRSLRPAHWIVPFEETPLPPR